MTALQKWHSLSLEVASTTAEAVEFAFNELDALGTEVIDFPKQVNATVTVTGYFDSIPAPAVLQEALDYAFQIYATDDRRIVSAQTTVIEDTDWLAEWKRYWKPSVVGNFVIAAPWHEVEEPEKIVIRIEPNMAFGTGTHETTQLCLAALQDNLLPTDSLLDVGTGTGILAIAAAKLARSEIRYLAIDNDPESISIATQNAQLNKAPNIDFKIATLSPDNQAFDFVCANLTLDAILPMLSLLIMKANRILVLSGILSEQENDIVEALKKDGVQDPQIVRAGEWIAVILRKN